MADGGGPICSSLGRSEKDAERLSKSIVLENQGLLTERWGLRPTHNRFRTSGL